MSELEAFTQHGGNRSAGLGDGEVEQWGANAAVLAEPVGVQYMHAFLWGSSFASTIIIFDIIPYSYAPRTEQMHALVLMTAAGPLSHVGDCDCS